MLGPKDIEHLAKLARLKLSGDEIENYQRELDAILDYVSKLQEIESESRKPSESRYSSYRYLELRDDDPSAKPFADDPGAKPDVLLEQMSEVKEGFLKVPKVIEKP